MIDISFPSETIPEEIYMISYPGGLPGQVRKIISFPIEAIP
jgi:hypothetical protein